MTFIQAYLILFGCILFIGSWFIGSMQSMQQRKAEQQRQRALAIRIQLQHGTKPEASIAIEGSAAWHQAGSFYRH